jgi:hypothetical protein
MSNSAEILKNGVQALILKNENKFKNSLVEALSEKLSSNINELVIKTNKKLFQPKFKWTVVDENVQYFINFLNEYNPNTYAKIKLKNDSLINITESEINNIKSLFNQLSPENRKTMVETIFENKSNLEQHLEFYNKTKVLEQ